MTPQRFRQLRIAFEELLAASATERPQRLERIAVDDPALAEELGRMLAVQTEGASVLDRAAADAISPPPVFEPGALFGSYRLEAELG
ncbi:MAG: hypothetical protein LAO79_15040, partial [Acidobacteriia bacterium]|nr:hypothetical protein [Terriglobia bacterium]